MNTRGARGCGNRGDRDQAPRPRASPSGTLGLGRDESPGRELHVTGSQAGPSCRDKGLIGVQTENSGGTADGALFTHWGPGKTSQGREEVTWDLGGPPSRPISSFSPRARAGLVLRPLGEAFQAAPAALFVPPLDSNCAPTCLLQLPPTTCSPCTHTTLALCVHELTQSSQPALLLLFTPFYS